MVQDVHARLHRVAVVRHVELVDGLVEAGVGVDVGAEGSTEPAQHVDQLVLGVLLGAVEHHVLVEVGDTGARSDLVDGTGADGQPQRRLAAGPFVVTHVVLEPVVERAGAHVVVIRDRHVGGVDQTRQRERAFRRLERRRPATSRVSRLDATLVDSSELLADASIGGWRRQYPR